MKNEKMKKMKNPTKGRKLQGLIFSK